MEGARGEGLGARGTREAETSRCLDFFVLRSSFFVPQACSLKPQACSARAQQGRGDCAPRLLREWVVTSTRKRSSCATAARRSLQVFVFSALHESLRSQRAVTKPHGWLRP